MIQVPVLISEEIFSFFKFLKQICKKLPYEEFSGVGKGKEDDSKVKNHGASPSLL